MTLRARIQSDMTASLKARETERLGTLRLLLAAIKQVEVDQRIELDDTTVVGIVQKLCKQRRDSIEQFTVGGRQDLADKEKQELTILSHYLPQALSIDDINAHVAAAIVALGATSPADMSRVMARLKPAVSGRADMGQVSQAVKAALSGLPNNV